MRQQHDLAVPYDDLHLSARLVEPEPAAEVRWDRDGAVLRLHSSEPNVCIHVPKIPGFLETRMPLKRVDQGDVAGGA
jgi:hypothetical protein